MKKNILITSFGLTWPIVPELIGFTNPGAYNLYHKHPDAEKIQSQRDEYKIEPVDEIWLAATSGKQVSDELEQLKKWFEKWKNLPVLRIFSYKTLKELDTIEEINPMADLIYSIVLRGKSKANGGKLYLSLAGGRKNMSANMQEAAGIFGCDLLIHVMDNGKIPADFRKSSNNGGDDKRIENFSKIPGEEIKCFFPVVLSGKKESSAILFVKSRITPHKFPLKETLHGNPSTRLFDELSNLQRESANTLFNHYQSMNREDAQSSFLGFQLLHPGIRQQLRDERIGVDPAKKDEDLKWLKKIPKADLHCHFGGILSPAEMIEVAKENIPEIKDALINNPGFRQWHEKTKKIVEAGEIKNLLPFNPKKNIRQRWADQGIREPVAIATFLTLFDGNPALLKEYIYGCSGNFKGIGIETYEKLGDLQGSSLMQNEKSIRKACRILKRQCTEHHIRYLELRCSPANYTRGGLQAEEVVKILTDELNGDNNTLFKLIFIASRHGDNDVIRQHIDLALKMRKTNAAFQKMFAGFDLAGAESAKSPRDMREIFMNILRESIPTTIHAGEDMPVENIWGAIYHLSAERIGHGLTLNDNPELKQRIKERKIAIELCPSSNDQIIGYDDNLKLEKGFTKPYPLRKYFSDGLKITVNTDDPGISLTNLTREYYKAACMTKDGLSKWEILQLGRNGFKYGFLPQSEKKKLLLEVEKELFELLNDE